MGVFQPGFLVLRSRHCPRWSQGPAPRPRSTDPLHPDALGVSGAGYLRRGTLLLRLLQESAAGVRCRPGQVHLDRKNLKS